MGMLVLMRISFSIAQRAAAASLWTARASGAPTEAASISLLVTYKWDQDGDHQDPGPPGEDLIQEYGNQARWTWR